MCMVFCSVERFLAIGSADCHWIVALLCSRKNFKRTNPENVQKQRDFCKFCVNVWPIFVTFLPGFPQGLIIVPKMPGRLPINFNSARTSDSGKAGS